MIRRDSTGKHEYTPEQREIIYRFMAEDNLGAEIASKRFMGNQAFNNILGEVRDLKKGKRQVIDRDGNPIEYRVQLTPVHDAINKLITKSKERAEARLLADSRYADLAAGIYTQQAVNEAMKAGDTEGAFAIAQRRQQQLSKQDKIKQFSQYR